MNLNEILKEIDWQEEERTFLREVFSSTVSQKEREDEGEDKMNCFLPFIEQKGMAILDGGLATQLESYGAVLKGNPLWSANCLISDPNTVFQVHLDYLNAGADIITTATYQASTDLLEKQGFVRTEDQLKFYRKGVQLARRAINEYSSSKSEPETFSESPDLIVDPTNKSFQKPLIAFSIGSYGASLGGGKEYSGDYGVPISQIISFHKKRMRLVSQLNDVDLIAFETIPCRREAIAIITILKEYPRLRCWLSFSCRNDDEIADGTPIVTLVKLVNSSKQIIAVGVNCTAPEYIGSLVKKMACRTTKVIIAYPNKGEVFDPQIANWKENSQKCDWTEQVLQWKKMGLGVVGGCCRTTPADIAKVHQLLISQPKQTN